MPDHKPLILVDGTSYLYRAFYALPPLVNSHGEPTGAVYGVLNMLNRLIGQYEPSHIGVVFDAPGKTFRDELFEEYKSHRPPMPDDMRSQIKPLKEIVAALGLPLLEVPGVEADDVIGTLAQAAQREGMKVIISTMDKDMAQLVNADITLLNTMSDVKMDVDGVRERFGVPPECIIDYLALVGDTSDNIPGVPRVGPKTAAKWLNQYGSLDNLLAHAEEIKGVAGNNLRETQSIFPMTRQLVTIRTDCEIPGFNGDWSVFLPSPQDRKALIELFEEYGFRTWLRELTGDAERIPEQDSRVKADAVPEPVQARYETVLDWDAFDNLLNRLQAAELVAMDTETTSLDPMAARLVGISFSMEPGVAAYVPVGHRGADHADQLPRDDVLARLKSWLENADRAKLPHNAKYETHALDNEGMRLAGVSGHTPHE